MSAQFIVDPSSVSFSKVKADLEAYLDTKPDAAAWQDFFASSVGQTILELAAGVGALISYNVITGRREVYLPYATNRSSVIAGAEGLGYSVFRGQNQHITLTIVPNQTISLPKYSVVGSVKEKDLILLEGATLNSGVATTISCVVGNLIEEIITAPSASIKVFKFSSPNVSEDIRAFIDGTELTISNRIAELVSGKCVLLTNAIGSVDFHYLNQAAPLYNTGSELKIQFVELIDLDFVVSNISLLYGAVTLMVTDSDYISPEDSDVVKINAPLAHETQFVIRGRDDYRDIFRLLDSSIISTNGYDISPAVVGLTYIRDNLSMFSTSEKASLATLLASYRPFGVQPAVISDPFINNLKLNIEIILLRQDPADDPVADVREILSGFEKRLAQGLDFSYLEYLIESLEYVKIARVSVDEDPWVASSVYRLGDYATPTVANGVHYRLLYIMKNTGVSEPAWPLIANALISDGSAVWRTYPLDPLATTVTWTASTKFTKSDIVVPTVSNGFMYKIERYKNFSGASEPTWQTTAGALTVDNNLIWRAVTLSGSPAVWAASTDYVVGTTVVPTVSNGFMYQLIEYRGTSGVSEPAWPLLFGNEISDNEIRWQAIPFTDNPPDLDWNQFFIITETVNIST